MLERQLGHIKPDMDVCDISGDKVGEIAHVYRHPEGASGDSGESNPGDDRRAAAGGWGEEGQTGFLGLAPTCISPSAPSRRPCRPPCSYQSRRKSLSAWAGMISRCALTG